MNRKEFLKLSSATGLLFFLDSCSLSSPEEDVHQEKTKELNKPLIEENANVVFITEADKKYKGVNQGFNKRVKKKPKVIALCKNTEGVAEAIKYAKEKKLQISVKSGGHSFEGFSSNNGGLVINLSSLNTIKWLANNEVLLGPGCTLSQIYSELLPKKRIIPAGSCASVGIAGLTLGGGYGFFSRKYGLTCDSLLKVTLVDGNGQIHSSENAEEILWACKGGGNGNFGVVTELFFKTFEAPNFFQSHRLKAFKLDSERSKVILEKWFEVVDKLPLSCFSAFVLNHKTLTILISNFEKHGDEIQELLNSISPLCDKITSGSPLKLEKALKVFYGIQKPIYFKNASAGLYKNFEQITPCISEVLKIVTDTPGLIYQINSLGGNISNAEFQTTSSYVHRDLPYLSELQTYWEKEEDGNKLIAKFEEIQQILKKNNITAHYVNYPDINFKNYQESYYGKYLHKLKEIKKKYDPDNNIRHEQSIFT